MATRARVLLPGMAAVAVLLAAGGLEVADLRFIVPSPATVVARLERK